MNNKAHPFWVVSETDISHLPGRLEKVMEIKAKHLFNEDWECACYQEKYSSLRSKAVIHVQIGGSR